MTIYLHTAGDRTPYTYLIGWSTHNKWYYGVRFAKNCHPDDLWNKYFTSSKYVKTFREEFGEPDIVQIRKIFNDPEKARLYEGRLLIKLKVIKNTKWLNMCASAIIDPESFRYEASKRMKIKNPMFNKEISQKVADKNKITNAKRMQEMSSEERSLKFGNFGENNYFYGKTHSEETRKKISKELKNKKNSESSPWSNVECHLCKKLFSKQNISRHIFSCSNGAEGIQPNKGRKGISTKKGYKWNPIKRKYINGTREKTFCITNGYETKRIKISQDIPEGYYLGRHYNPKSKNITSGAA